MSHKSTNFAFNIFLLMYSSFAYTMITDFLATAVKAYGLIMTNTLAHELGHASVATLCGDQKVTVNLGTPSSKPPILEIGKLKILSLNPLRAFCAFDEKSRTALQTAMICAAGPLTGLAFSYLIDPSLAPNSFLQSLNNYLLIWNILNYWPVRMGYGSSDGKHICDVLDLNYNTMRLASLSLYYAHKLQAGKQLFKLFTNA